MMKFKRLKLLFECWMISLLWFHLYSPGQKGIGFKSVFKVSDCPEIHSNGFHLRFDKTSGPMGYILPHWAEADRPLDSQLEDIKQHRSDCWQMCCVLYRYFKNITKYSLNKNIWLRTNRLKLNMLLLKKLLEQLLLLQHPKQPQRTIQC